MCLYKTFRGVVYNSSQFHFHCFAAKHTGAEVLLGRSNIRQFLMKQGYLRRVKWSDVTAVYFPISLSHPQINHAPVVPWEAAIEHALFSSSILRSFRRYLYLFIDIHCRTCERKQLKIYLPV